MRGKVVLIDFEIRWEQENLLYLPNVAVERLKADMGVEIPELDSTIVRGGEECSGWQIDLHRVDPVSMPLQNKAFLSAEVVHDYSAVRGPGSKEFPGHVHTDDASRVDLECIDALSCSPIPDLYCIVQTASDETGVVEMKAADALSVTSQGADNFTSLKVPDLHRRVV
jgi:hypothetical protein